MSQVFITVGLPASGKSSVFNSIQNTVEVLNRDKTGGKVIDLLPKMKPLLKAGKDIFLDNTFCTAEERKPFIQEAKKHNAVVTCIWVNTSIEDAQFNACMRMIERKGKLLMPEDFKTEKDPNLFPPAVLFAYNKKFQKPEASEGFDCISTYTFNRQFPSDWTNKAIFLDYDGTLRESKIGNKYPLTADEISILPNRAKVLDHYKKQGYMLLGVSNQSGVSKNKPTMAMAKACFDYTNALLKQDIEVKFCPHAPAPINCFCRKPMPGMAIEFFNKYKLKPSDCIMVGDMTSDKTFAKRSYLQYVDANEFFA